MGLSDSVVVGCSRVMRRRVLNSKAQAGLAVRQKRRRSRVAAVMARGFTLIDLLVSIAVMAVLIGFLLPSLVSAHETARRVVCRSNVRQIGLGLVMYANDNDGRLPSSVFLDQAIFSSTVAQQQLGENSSDLTRMVSVRVAAGDPKLASGGWDGLGHLHDQAYTNASKVFYCPSHKGENTHVRFARSWDAGLGEIIGNYHYRGYGPMVTGRFTNHLYEIEPPSAAIIADGLQTRDEVNHEGGINIFRADLSAEWFGDPTMRLSLNLPEDKESNAENNGMIARVWRSFDELEDTTVDATAP